MPKVREDDMAVCCAFREMMRARKKKEASKSKKKAKNVLRNPCCAGKRLTCCELAKMAAEGSASFTCGGVKKKKFKRIKKPVNPCNFDHLFTKIQPTLSEREKYLNAVHIICTMESEELIRLKEIQKIRDRMEKENEESEECENQVNDENLDEEAASATTSAASATKSTASGAKSTASATKSTASGAKSTRSDTKSTRSAAKSTRSGTKSTRSAAKSTRSGTKSTRSAAKSTRSAAKSTRSGTTSMSSAATKSRKTEASAGEAQDTKSVTVRGKTSEQVVENRNSGKKMKTPGGKPTLGVLEECSSICSFDSQIDLTGLHLTKSDVERIEKDREEIRQQQKCDESQDCESNTEKYSDSHG